MTINRNNTSATVAIVAAGFSCISFMFGCSGSPDRPPPSTVDTTNSTATPNAAVANHDPCEPGTWRECRMHYVDADGQAQCPMDVELCREDGAGYYDCGTWVTGADGTPTPRSAVQQTTKK